MKKRKDSFFGLHFDFHASENTKGIGAEFDPAVLEKIIAAVKPDFVQCDTKGHPGYSSYPTKVGTPAPEIARDILREWREITEKHDVALYAHHSGVLESRAAALHPEWTIRDADGNPTERMSSFGEYADKLLIPQLKELALDYGLNGAWIDGECWAVWHDWSKKAIEAFVSERGKQPPKPRNGVNADTQDGGHSATLGQKTAEEAADEELMEEYSDFLRKAFFRYVRHYVEEVHKAAPDFEITSNWLNSPQAPDAVCVTDYISADYDSENSVDSARFCGRVVADFERPWDLMAWGFRFNGLAVKTYEQLCQEAAAVVMLGGGVQLYNIQDYRRVVRDEWAVPMWAKLAGFCRERQPFCHQAKPVHEAAVIYSVKAFYRKKESLFGTWGSDYPADTQGLLFSALDAGFATEILLSHKAMERDLSAYSLLVLGDAHALEPELKEKLIAYVKGGGTLALFGTECANFFAEAFGLRRTSRQSEKVFDITVNGMRYPVQCPHADSEGMAAGEYESKPFGKGRVLSVPFVLGTAYQKGRSAALRDYAAEVFSPCKRKLHIEGQKMFDCALMQKEGKEYIHVLNMAGEHRAASARTFDEIPPLYGLQAEYAAPRRPVRVVKLPGGRETAFSYENGTLRFAIDRVDIHCAYEITYEKEDETRDER